ncbi:MAG: SBBP repeat-containing protein [Chloroflexi bacterium]|nr:SBBP repeat-containing protein [Chloroflexota bacterium]
MRNNTLVRAFPLFLFIVAGLMPGLVWADNPPTELWIARYNGPGNSADHANAVGVDGAGNVYVTGWSAGSGTASDYVTIKYNSGGNQVWVARYNGPGNDADDVQAMAVDSSGNVYVTGQSIGSGTGYDYATVKYDSGGNQVWAARYNGPGNASDYAYALAVDGAGNVYVTGISYGSGTGEDYATIKYDSSGNQLWVARYDSGSIGAAPDEARAIAVDGSGNVYVTGQSIGSGTGYDYATVKYDSGGNQVWAARYNGPMSPSSTIAAATRSGKPATTAPATLMMFLLPWPWTAWATSMSLAGALGAALLQTMPPSSMTAAATRSGWPATTAPAIPLMKLGPWPWTAQATSMSLA